MPDTILNKFGWDYLPDRYWSIAIPAFIIIATLLILPFYFAINITKTNSLESINNISDEYSLNKHEQIQITNKSDSKHDGIDPVYDIPISQICEYLYKN